MSTLLDRINKLIEDKKRSRIKSFFIIAESLEDEKKKIEALKKTNNDATINMTIFKLYE